MKRKKSLCTGIQSLRLYFDENANSDPDIGFRLLIFIRMFSSPEDVRYMTGFSKETYEKVFEEDPQTGNRMVRTDLKANRALMDHLGKADDMTFGQYRISEMLWKLMRSITLAKIKEQQGLLEPRFPGDDNVITKDDLCQAVRSLFSSEEEHK